MGPKRKTGRSGESSACQSDADSSLIRKSRRLIQGTGAEQHGAIAIGVAEASEHVEGGHGLSNTSGQLALEEGAGGSVSREERKEKLKEILRLKQTRGLGLDKSVVALEKELSARFQDTEIEVSGTSRVPIMAWIVNNSTDEDEFSSGNEKRCIDIASGSGYVIPLEVKEKWTDAVEKGESEESVVHAALIDFTIDNAKTVIRSLKFNEVGDSEVEWYIDDRDEDTRRNSSETEPSIAGLGDSKFGDKDLKEVMESYRKANDEDEQISIIKCFEWNHHMDIQFTLASNLIIDFLDYMRSAFINSMTNSKGRRFLRSLLSVAAKLEIGMKGKDVFVFDVGSSSHSSEGFPVRKKQQAQDAYETLDSASVLNLQLAAQTGSGSDTSCVNSAPSTLSSDRSDDGYVYPDCVIATFDKSGSGRYLLVAQLKSGGRFGFDESEKCQLVRKMIGAGIHQTEVFGLLMNAASALICRMKFEKETFYLYKSVYHFPLYSIQQQSFSHRKFVDFFKDLLAVTSYAMENIEVV